MDFFGRQEQAKRSTVKLIVLLGLAVLAVVAAVTISFAMAVPPMFLRREFVGHLRGDASMADMWHHLLNPAAVEWVAVGKLAGLVAFLIICASIYKAFVLKLSKGAGIARMLGGRLLTGNREDPGEQRLQNVVEEMAIASGVPMPAIYILEGEKSINAFAAGFTHEDAVIGVTRGSIDSLTRDELQGVVAHEFSHILHGDMSLNVRLMGVLYGLLVISEIGRAAIRSAGRSRNSKNQGGGLFFGLVLMAIGMIGYLFGAIIRAAVSRQREYLADAAATQFTRNPGGLAGALAKAGKLSVGDLEAPRAGEVGHMLFVKGAKNFFGSLTATHPPLANRIAALRGIRPEQVRPAAGSATAVASPASSASGLVSNLVGTVSSEGIQRASGWLGTIPTELKFAAHSVEGAAALVTAISIDRDPAKAEGQLQGLRSSFGDVVDRISGLLPYVRTLRPADMLPLIDLSMTGLRQLPPLKQEALLAALQQVVAADGRMQFAEFAVISSLRHRLRQTQTHSRAGTPTASASAGAAPAANRSNAATIMISAVAAAGAADDTRARACFAAAASKLPKGVLTSDTPIQWTFETLENALDALAAAAPASKRALLDACAHAAAADGVVGADEVHIVHAISAALHCPMPTFMV